MSFYEFEGKRPRVDKEAFVHPLAVLIGDVEVDAGCYMGAGAVLRGDFGSIRVGSGSNVQENCVLHCYPDKVVLLHPNSHIGHGSILHGCEICSSVLVGMGSVIPDGVKINSDCLIGARTFIEFGTEIPQGSLVLGAPAKGWSDRSLRSTEANR
ncbi:MAG: gamma carbonic anhydrase family protein [Deltaproteobacteria bacterium]